MLEQDTSQSLIVAATNHSEILDYALLRRFDDVLEYRLPDLGNIATLLKSCLSHKSAKGLSWKRLAKLADGLSYADLSRAADESLKHSIMVNNDTILETDVKEAIKERKRMKTRFKNIRSHENG